MTCSGTKYSHEFYFIHEMFLILGRCFLFWLFLLGLEGYRVSSVTVFLPPIK